MKRFILTRRIALYVYCMMINQRWSNEFALRKFYETVREMDACSTYEEAEVIENQFWRSLVYDNSAGIMYDMTYAAWCLAYDWKKTF